MVNEKKRVYIVSFFFDVYKSRFLVNGPGPEFTRISQNFPKFTRISENFQAALCGVVRALDAPATSRVLWEASGNTGDERSGYQTVPEHYEFSESLPLR